MFDVEFDLATLVGYVAAYTAPFLTFIFVAAALYFAFSSLGSVMDGLGVVFRSSVARSSAVRSSSDRRGAGSSFDDWSALQDPGESEEVD